MESRYAWTIPLRERHPLIQWALDNGRMLKDVLAELGISRPTLNYWDRGKCKPSSRTQEKIRVLTNGAVTPDALHDHWLSKQRKEAA